MTSKACMHCVVSGRVQGVFFRAGTKSKADQLGVTGWVRNTPEGNVEVMACGEPEQLDAMYEWLQSGTVAANVTNLTRDDVGFEVFAGFEVRR